MWTLQDFTSDSRELFVSGVCFKGYALRLCSLATRMIRGFYVFCGVSVASIWLITQESDLVRY